VVAQQLTPGVEQRVGIDEDAGRRGHATSVDRLGDTMKGVSRGLWTGA